MLQLVVLGVQEITPGHSEVKALVLDARSLRLLSQFYLRILFAGPGDELLKEARLFREMNKTLRSLQGGWLSSCRSS